MGGNMRLRKKDAKMIIDGLHKLTGESFGTSSSPYDEEKVEMLIDEIKERVLTRKEKEKKE